MSNHKQLLFVGHLMSTLQERLAVEYENAVGESTHSSHLVSQKSKIKIVYADFSTVSENHTFSVSFVLNS